MATAIIGTIVIGAFASAYIYIRKEKNKTGSSGACSGCSGCANSCNCHKV